MVRKAEDAIFSSQPSEEAIRLAMSTLDKAAVKGIIHKNNAARRKSRLMKKLNSFQPLAEAGAGSAKKGGAKRARAGSAKPAAAKPAKATSPRRATAKG